MALDVINNDLHVNGNFTCKTFDPPDGSLTNSHFSASADIDATKVEHQIPLDYQQVPGTAILAATSDLHIVHGAGGSVVSFRAAVTGAIATGADRTVNVDLQKSTGAGAFATILSATLLFNNVSVLRTVGSAAIATPALVAGDILRVVVAVAGSAGNQAQGLIVTATIREDAS